MKRLLLPYTFIFLDHRKLVLGIGKLCLEKAIDALTLTFYRDLAHDLIIRELMLLP